MMGAAEPSARLTLPEPAARSGGEPRRCRTWLAEAALRCLENNLHPDVAEDPGNLVVYGGRGKAARDQASLAAIKATLVDLAADETLLVQSGKPVAVFPTHPFAPRVLIANSLLVPEWATWEEFWRLEALGLTMYGQMTAGSWIYIGTQGIVQGTYQTFLALAEQRFGGTLTGRVILTAGLGGMGGAQPLAVTMIGGVALCIEVDPARLRRRLDTGWLDEEAPSVEEGLRRARAAADAGNAVSIGVVANAADAFPALLAAGALRSTSSPTRPAPTTRSTAMCRPACRWRRRRRCVLRIPRTTCAGPGPGWPSTARPWPVSPAPAPRSSTTATRCGPGRSTAGSTGSGPSPIPGSCRPTCGRCSAKGWDRSGGWRSPVTRLTSPPPTPRCAGPFPTTTVCSVGCGWRRSGCRSRACPPGSAGWATASATPPAWRSTNWSAAARWALRSSSAGTTSTPAPSPPPTGKRRRWPTAPTPSPTGPSSTPC